MARKSEEWVINTASAQDGIAEIGYSRVLHIAKVWLAANEPTPLGWMPICRFPIYLVATFHFASDSDDVHHVELEHSNPLGGSTLQRFAWSQWLARARDQRAAALERETKAERWQRSDALWRTLGADRPNRRPGRGGHGDDWWRALGARIDALDSDGISGGELVAAIVEEYDLPPDDSGLAHGWIKQARKKRYARPGRAGRPPKREDEL